MEGVYGNYAMPSSLARHHVHESCNAILFSQSSYMGIVSCHIFFHNVFHLSTMFIHSSTLPVHQPFELVMGKSGVKTRSSEQSVLPVDADFLLVTDSSSEEDSERDDQSYPPRGACSNLAGLYCSYHAYGVLHCHAICLD